MAVVAKLDILTNVNTAPLTAGFKRGEMAAKRFSQKVGGATRGLATAFISLRTAVIAMGVAMAAMALRSAVGYVRSTMEAIDQTAKLARTLSMTTEKLGGLQHAAKLAGIEGAAFGKGMIRMQDAAAKASEGDLEQAEAFAFFGLKAKEIAQLAPDEMFLRIAETIDKVGLGTQTTSKLLAVFGRAGAQMIPLFEGGRESIEGFIAEAQRLGIVVGTVASRQVEQANDAMTRFKSALGGLGITIAVEVAPMLEKLSNLLAESTGEFNRTSTVVSEIGNVFLQIARVFLNVASTLNTVFQSVKGLLIGFINTLAWAAKWAEKFWNVLLPSSLETTVFADFSREMAAVTKEVADDLGAVWTGGLWGENMMKAIERARQASRKIAEDAERSKTKRARWQDPSEFGAAGGGSKRLSSPAAAERGTLEAAKAIVANMRRNMGIDKQIDVGKQQVVQLKKIEENTRKAGGLVLAGAGI